MRRGKILRLILALILVSVLLPGSTFTTASNPEHVDVLIGFHTQIDRQAVTELGGQVRHSYKYMPVVAARIPAQAVTALSVNPAVAFVEEDGIIEASQVVPWGVSRIGARDVHLEYGVTGHGVRVAVLDTGIADNHQDLVVHGGADFTGAGHWRDNHGHGTHVAGTIAALDNTVDVVGVAPHARLYSVKVLNQQGSGQFSWLIAGIEWCITNDIKVINMSLGSSTHSAAVEQACLNAWNAGILLVAAAGNAGNHQGSGDNVGYPARYPTVMAVGATTINDVRAWYSSTGPDLEIMAPGDQILSTTWPSGTGISSGTSMAAPHVAGTAALILRAQPGWTNSQVRARLNDTTESIGNGNPWQYGNGLVDAYAALTDYNLHVDVWTSSPTYSPGSKIPIYIRVRTGMGLPVPGAAIALLVEGPDATIGYKGITTDYRGRAVVSYSHQLSHGIGQFHATATARKSGYITGTGTTSFSVNW